MFINMDYMYGMVLDFMENVKINIYIIKFSER